MSPVILTTPKEALAKIAKNAQAKRLFLNLSQTSLAARSGVSLGSLKLFEQSGKISLASLLKIALVLNSLDEFTQLFKNQPINKIRSLDELLTDNQRKRGRK